MYTSDVMMCIEISYGNKHIGFHTLLKCVDSIYHHHHHHHQGILKQVNAIWTYHTYINQQKHTYMNMHMKLKKVHIKVDHSI